MTNPTTNPDDRDTAIRLIRAALRERSGVAWSVRGGAKRATDWGWITITAPPARADDFGGLRDDDRDRLAQLLGLPTILGSTVSVDPRRRVEFVERAQGIRSDR